MFRVMLLCLICCVSLGAYAGNYGYSGGMHTAHLGRGFNPFDPSINYPNCLDEESIEVSKFSENRMEDVAQKTEVTMELLTARKDFYGATNISASLTGGNAFAHGHAQISKEEKTRFHADSLTWIITFKSDFGDFGPERPHLSKYYDTLSVDELYEKCGPEIVTSLRKGVVLYAMVTVDHLEESTQRTIKGLLEGKMTGVGYNAELQSKFDSFVRTASAAGSIHVVVDAIGGPGIVEFSDMLYKEVPQVTDTKKGTTKIKDYGLEINDIPRILSKYMKFMDARRSGVIGISTMDIRKIKQGHIRMPENYNPEDAEFANIKLGELHLKFLDLESVRKRISEVQSGLIINSSLSSEVKNQFMDELNSFSEEYNDAMNDLCKIARACREGRMNDCVAPKIRVPSVDFRKYEPNKKGEPLSEILKNIRDKWATDPMINHKVAGMIAGAMLEAASVQEIDNARDCRVCWHENRPNDKRPHCDCMSVGILCENGIVKTRTLDLQGRYRFYKKDIRETCFIPAGLKCIKDVGPDGNNWDNDWGQKGMHFVAKEE